jgi:hypothetical protein
VAVLTRCGLLEILKQCWRNIICGIGKECPDCVHLEA